jgi:hypothetical protein
MKDKIILPENGEAQELSSSLPHRSLRSTVIAVLLCALLAVAVWLCVMNLSDTDYVALEVEAPRDGYTYELSAHGVEVTGAVYALKDLDRIGVIVPGHVPGIYTLTQEDLVLPEGVHLSGELYLTLTVAVD